MSYNPLTKLRDGVKSLTDRVIVYSKRKGKDESYAITIQDLLGQSSSSPFDKVEMYLIAENPNYLTTPSVFSGPGFSTKIAYLTIQNMNNSVQNNADNFQILPADVLNDAGVFEIKCLTPPKRYLCTITLTAKVDVAGIYYVGVDGRALASVTSQVVNGNNLIQVSTSALLSLSLDFAYNVKIMVASDDVSNGDRVIPRTFSISLQEV